MYLATARWRPHTGYLQAEIMGAAGSESDWNKHVNDGLEYFPLIRALCNGSKHFDHNLKDQGGYSSPSFDYATGSLHGIVVHVVEAGAERVNCIISVKWLLESARDFWIKMFEQFPQLGSREPSGLRGQNSMIDADASVLSRFCKKFFKYVML